MIFFRMMPSPVKDCVGSVRQRLRGFGSVGGVRLLPGLFFTLAIAIMLLHLINAFIWAKAIFQQGIRFPEPTHVVTTIIIVTFKSVGEPDKSLLDMCI